MRDPGDCPCCGEAGACDLAAHACGGCYREVCAECKVDDRGESSPCRGICRDCRARGVSEGTLAVRSLRRIEAELVAGAIPMEDLDEVVRLAGSIVGIIADVIEGMR